MRLVGNIPDDLEYRTLTIAKIIWWNCCCLVGALAISSWGKNYQPLVAPPFEMDHQIITTIGIIVILILIIAILTIIVTTCNNNTYYIMMCACRCVTYVIICITCYYVNNNALLLGPKKSGPSGSSSAPFHRSAHRCSARRSWLIQRVKDSTLRRCGLGVTLG